MGFLCNKIRERQMKSLSWVCLLEDETATASSFAEEELERLDRG